MAARRETPPVSARDVGEGAARVAEADGRETRLGLRARQVRARLARACAATALSSGR